MATMSSIRFLFLALLIFVVVGPLVPVPAMFLLTGGTTLKAANLVAGFFSEPLGLIAFSYLIGAPIAFAYGLAFVTLLLLPLHYLPFLRFAARWASVVHGALIGAAIAAPVMIWRAVTNPDHLAFNALLFVLPSVLCGVLIGFFFLPKLIANMASTELQR
jgi:hypothetical protein